MKNSKNLYLVSVITGLILSIAWYDFGTGLILLFVIVPILYLVDTAIKHSRKNTFLIKLFIPLFLIWSASSGWWLVNATVPGAIFLIILSSIFYCTIILLYKSVKTKLGNIPGYFALISFWIGFEYIYLNAKLSVPWINLGNGLSHDIMFIQWYEFTGTLGGSFWILISNILIYEVLKSIYQKRTNKKLIWTLIIVLAFPSIVSINMFHRYRENGKTIDVVSVQPNVDPYEKFVSFTPGQQKDTIIKLFTPFLSESIDYIITPETSITGYSDIRNLGNDRILQDFFEITNKYKRINIVLGMTLLKSYGKDKKIPTTAQLGNNGVYFNTFNSAVQVNRGSIQTYHKSKLFPGVEMMPYSNSLRFLHKLMINLGGTFRSHGISDERINLISYDSTISAAPVICWENIYGEFVTGFIKNGANVIFNITNEGWWGDTPGYKMFNNFARLRAIETRRSVVRSANTGISAFINQKGEVLNKLTWDKKGAISGSVALNDKITFYARFGDYIGKIFKITAILLLLFLVINFFLPKKYKIKNLQIPLKFLMKTHSKGKGS